MPPPASFASPQTDNASPSPVLGPNLLLIALPTAIGLANIHTSAALAAVLGLAVVGLVKAHRTTDRIRLTVPSLILPALGMSIAFRPSQVGAITSPVFFFASCVALALAVAVSPSRRNAFDSLIDGIGVLLFAAAVLRFAGIGVSAGKAVTGNFLTGGERVQFPLLGALTSGPTLASAYLVAALPLIWRTRQHIVLRGAFAVSAVYVLVQGDRRSALFATVLILFLTTVAPRAFRRVVPWAVGALMTLPILLEATGLLKSGIYFSLNYFRRSGEQNSESIGQRFEIWSRSLSFYENWVDPYDQAFGFGSSGHVTSGASLTYRSLFGPRGQNLNTPHNSVLQTLFDGGWIAASIFVATVLYLAWVLSRGSGEFEFAGLAMLAALATVGTTEALMAPGYPQPVWWTVMALGLIGFAKEAGPAPPTIRDDPTGHGAKTP